MANNFTLLCSLHLLLSTSFCLHASLERNINFVHEVLRVKCNAFKKFLAGNIFVRRNYDNFSHKSFGNETNGNENKANYGIHVCCIQNNYCSKVYIIELMQLYIEHREPVTIVHECMPHAYLSVKVIYMYTTKSKGLE